jgi:hypothetical protein
MTSSDLGLNNADVVDTLWTQFAKTLHYFDSS